MEKKFRHRDVVNALLENCKQSDREIATTGKVSQPTVTRIRGRLEKTGIIRGYLAIPDYAKIGFKLGAITICELRPGTSLKALLSKNSVVVSAPTISVDSNFMLITVHRTLEEYDAFLHEIKAVAVDGRLNVTLLATPSLEVKPVRVPEKGT